ncbi:hypothetical protein [Catellatospora sp. NPDC049609]|uniref:hypothetical protein n=1 Tax=Catellatospora sp. NPDC049609 TaxID=3155505 RepID=UPI00342D6B9A
MWYRGGPVDPRAGGDALVPVAAEAAETLPHWSPLRRFAEFADAPGPADPSAGYAADAVTLLHQAFLGHRDRKAARDALESACCIGVTGVYTMSPEDHGGLAADALTVATSRAGSWTTRPAPAP